jgi:hypothetical protein
VEEVENIDDADINAAVAINASPVVSQQSSLHDKDKDD